MRDNEPNNCEQTILKIKTHDNIKLHWLRWLRCINCYIFEQKGAKSKLDNKVIFQVDTKLLCKLFNKAKVNHKDFGHFSLGCHFRGGLQERPHFSS